MKKNAIIRIILWAVVLVLLLGIFLTVLQGYLLIRSYRTASETGQPLTATVVSADIMMENTNSPAPTAPIATGPAATVAATQYTTPGAIGNEYTVSANQIREIDIQWVAGNITIQSGTGTDILVQEEGEYASQYTMYVLPKKDELSISYLPTGTNHLKLDPDAPSEKNLTITIPQTWSNGKVEISSASSNVNVTGLNLREFDLEGSSGAAVFTDCTIESLDMATASGDVSYTGSLNKLDWEAASASLNAVFTNIPQEMDLESVSGILDITLPSNAGFTMESEGIIKNFSTDFATSQKNGRIVAGNGQCKIDIESVSNSVTIRKGDAA